MPKKLCPASAPSAVRSPRGPSTVIRTRILFTARLPSRLRAANTSAPTWRSPTDRPGSPSARACQRGFGRVGAGSGGLGAGRGVQQGVAARRSGVRMRGGGVRAPGPPQSRPPVLRPAAKGRCPGQRGSPAAGCRRRRRCGRLPRRPPAGPVRGQGGVRPRARARSAPARRAAKTAAKTREKNPGIKPRAPAPRLRSPDEGRRVLGRPRHRLVAAGPAGELRLRARPPRRVPRQLGAPVRVHHVQLRLRGQTRADRRADGQHPPAPARPRPASTFSPVRPPVRPTLNRACTLFTASAWLHASWPQGGRLSPRPSAGSGRSWAQLPRAATTAPLSSGIASLSSKSLGREPRRRASCGHWGGEGARGGVRSDRVYSPGRQDGRRPSPGAPRADAQNRREAKTPAPAWPAPPPPAPAPAATDLQ